MATYNRKTAPKVRDGRVQKKNRHAPTPTYWNQWQAVPVIDKERAGRGYQHLLSKKDILAFIEILPDWNDFAVRLDAVLLAKGEFNVGGWYVDGIVAVCAWENDLWRLQNKDFVREHQELFDRLGVPCERDGQNVMCKFTENTARAYQLLHIFLHELGHHHDAVSDWSKSAGDKERYAESWAFKYEQVVWDTYLRNFDL